MNSKEFKYIFGEISKANHFKYAFGGWYKESSECICVLELQKSNFGNYYQLNIKVFIQGVFNENRIIEKRIIKNLMGDINSSAIGEDQRIFDFDSFIDDNKRIELLKDFFRKHIIPFTTKVLSISGIKELANKGEILLLPAVKEELDRLEDMIDEL